MDQFKFMPSPWEHIKISRGAGRNQKSLQGWDGADLLLLDHCSSLLENNKSIKDIAIFNDNFGALAVGLTLLGYRVTTFLDSYISHNALKENLVLNDLDSGSVQVKSDLSDVKSCGEVVDQSDLVLLKVPKTLSHLKHQLVLIAAAQNSTPIVSAGMVKNVHNSTLKLYEDIVGLPRTSLAKKKARMIFVDKPATKKMSLPIYTTRDGDLSGIELISFGGVFSAEKLDIGSRFFLQVIHNLSTKSTIVDLGCGNGVLAAVYGKSNPNSELVLTDDSKLALASAQMTLEKNQLPNKITMIHGDGLDQVEEKSADLILCNPPFHHNNEVSRVTANKMIRGSWNTLKSGGELYLVANRHLGYHLWIKRVFGAVEIVTSNKKFVVLRGIKKD